MTDPVPAETPADPLHIGIVELQGRLEALSKQIAHLRADKATKAVLLRDLRKTIVGLVSDLEAVERDRRPPSPG